MTTRALTVLNECGDVTICWQDERDDEMEAVIQKKMDAGMVFFIVTPRAFGLLPPKKVKLENAADARKHRALAIPDEDFAKFVESGAGEAVATPAEKIKGSRISRSAKEVAENQSVGVKPRKGG